MPRSITAELEPLKIGLQGAYFETGNLGVSALAESCLNIIFHRWPHAKVLLFSKGSKAEEHRLSIDNKQRYIETVPIQFGKNIILKNHFLAFLCCAVLLKVFRWTWFKRVCCYYNPSFKKIIETDIVTDISGGDSFADIYGMRTLLFCFLSKWLVLLFNKPLVLLPQTYGPFNSLLSKVLARYILRRASIIYTRDKEGVKYVHDLMKNRDINDKVRLCQDVAFVLDSRKPKDLEIELPPYMRSQDSMVIGLNISGLLYNGGFTRGNMFGLKSDYKKIVFALVECLMKQIDVRILLIPHVFPPAGCEVESDSNACLEVYEKLNPEYSGRLFLAKGEYDHNEIKYIIGMCDFFIGSRMHSCIAALSQCIPAIGIAYSKKFQGVFGSIELSHCVVDARSCDEKQVVEKIELALEHKDEIREHLRDIMPKVRANILNIFKN